MNIGDEIEHLIRARYPILSLVSSEEARVQVLLLDIARRRQKAAFEWTCTSGLTPAGYVPGTRDMVAMPNGSIQSFCIESSEYINPTSYWVNLSSAANEGGVPGGVDPLSVGAAYLYSQFAEGTLAGYDYTNTGVGRKTSAGQLQQACGGWRLKARATTPRMRTWRSR